MIPIGMVAAEEYNCTENEVTNRFWVDEQGMTRELDSRTRRVQCHAIIGEDDKSQRPRMIGQIMIYPQ